MGDPQKNKLTFQKTKTCVIKQTGTKIWMRKKIVVSSKSENDSTFYKWDTAKGTKLGEKISLEFKINFKGLLYD